MSDIIKWFYIAPGVRRSFVNREIMHYGFKAMIENNDDKVSTRKRRGWRTATIRLQCGIIKGET